MNDAKVNSGITVEELRKMLAGLPGDSLVVLSRGEFSERDDNFSPLASVDGLKADEDVFYVPDEYWYGRISDPEMREIYARDGEEMGGGPRCVVLQPLTPYDVPAPTETPRLTDFDDQGDF